MAKDKAKAPEVAPTPAPEAVQEEPTGKDENGGFATEADLDDICRNPIKYGFRWVYEAISAVKDKAGVLLAGGKKLVLRAEAPRPYVEPENVEAFRQAFGNVIIAKAINGTSVDVAAEDILRRELLGKWAERRAANVSTYDLQVAIVRSVLLGQRAKGGGGSRKVWIVDGVAYANEADAMEASKAKPAAFTDMRGNVHGTKVEADAANVAILVDSGMDGNMARKVVSGM